MTSSSFIEGSDVLLSHLGLVAGAYDSLGICDVIDPAIPKTRPSILSHGAVVKAMILNGLGFVERRLYLFPEFFTDIPTSRLLGTGITPKHLNDDALGRTLDAIASYGSTELFNEIVSKCLFKSDYGTYCLHVDTTSFSVSGEYDADFNSHDMTITYGHSKDHRTDMKQFVLGMATDQRGIPLYLQALSGNASDKKTLKQIITHLTDNLKHPSKVYHVADAAFYTAENITTVGLHTFWISRAPATLNEVKALVSSDEPLCPCEDERYQYAEHYSEYADISQKWVLYESKMQQERQEKTFQKTLEKKQKTAQTTLRKLCKQEFACIPDATTAAEKWILEHPLFRFASCEVETQTRKKSQKRGRPKASEEMEVVYSISAEIEYEEEIVNRLRRELGRFVLATNDLELSANDLLKHYKGQGAVERGFRFLKDPTFRIDDIYLKKTSRIQALAMIMVLCLFVYSTTEFQLRKKLDETRETVTGPTKKQIQKPTLKWTFYLFRRVKELRFKEKEKEEVVVTNMTPELWKILKLMGHAYEKYYV